jgi:hypothetical protein
LQPEVRGYLVGSLNLLDRSTHPHETNDLGTGFTGAFSKLARSTLLRCLLLALPPEIGLDSLLHSVLVGKVLSVVPRVELGMV